MPFSRLIPIAVLLLAASVAAGQTGPQLATVFPPGARAGATVEVAFTGLDFDGEEKLLFSEKGFEAERIGGVKPDPKKGKGKGPKQSTIKFKVTAPKDFAGMTDVRVVSKSGLSNPRTFAVGSLNEVNETEPNNDIAQAQKIALETTVNGIISAPTDVDYVRFPAKAGQNIVVYCLTTSIDSKLSADIMMSTAGGKQLAANRGYRGGDAVLDFKAPADGDYLVRVAQFAYTSGGTDHFYRLTVTTGEWIDVVWPPLAGTGKGWFTYGRNGPNAETGKPFKRPDGRPFDSTDVWDHVQVKRNRLETTRLLSPPSGALDAIDWREPSGNLLMLAQRNSLLDNEKNATAETAQPVKLPCDIAGRIAKKNDRHYYSFEAKKGDVWTLEVFADRLGSPIDAYFVLADDKGKVITEQDDGPAPLSPNQFYSKSDDPDRYRFAVPKDGKYTVMVSSRDAGIQFGIREQYVLRIAKENPDFRLVVMPVTPHLPDAGTVAKGGAVLFNVYVFRMDGFNDSIDLSANDLPEGVTCPPQSIPAGQARGVLVLVADDTADDWDGFVTIIGTAGKLERRARPFSVTWPIPGVQPNQPPPNTPTITRMDRGPGLALAIRGDAPFSLAPVEKELKGKAGGKIELTLKIKRDKNFKDTISVFSAVPYFGPRQQGNQPPKAIATLTKDKDNAKISIDIPGNLAPGTYTLVLNGQSGAPQAKGPNVQPQAMYPTLPITVVVGKR